MSFSCLQVWRRLHNSCTNSRVQPWPQACPGVLWTRLSRKCAKRETPEHATVPASLLLVVSGQDIQHPLPEQKATPHRRLLCLSDNTWPSKLSVQSTFSCRVRMPGPSSPLWARKFSLSVCALIPPLLLLPILYEHMQKDDAFYTCSYCDCCISHNHYHLWPINHEPGILPGAFFFLMNKIYPNWQLIGIQEVFFLFLLIKLFKYASDGW